MNRKDILYSVLITVSLALNPLSAMTLTLVTQQQTNTLSATIAQNLYSRGLDEEAAQRISKEFFEDKEELFSFMLKNLANGCGVLSEQEILEHISSQALKKARIRLDSYSSLVSMVQKIKNQVASKETLLELQNIATKNTLFSKYVT